MKKINLAILSFIFSPSLGFAFFCPGNFNQIQIGDTMAQVQAQCGSPAQQETSEKRSEGPQEWNYYITQTVGTSSMSQTQGTLKTQVTFDGSGKAINISVNGIGVGSTALCGSMIQLGDTQNKVKSACGAPSLVNKQSPEEQSTSKITSFIYNTNPPVTLMFENGVLTGKQ